MLQLTMSNISPMSSRLWVHAISVWVVSLVAFWVSRPGRSLQHSSVAARSHASGSVYRCWCEEDAEN